MVLFDYTSVSMIKKDILRWLPAILVMSVIFGFSSIPSSDLPVFGSWDLVAKKSGHMLGYGLLALAYWGGWQFDKERWWLALLMTVLYALFDEFHQSFTPGRHPSWVDALIIDQGGALISLGLAFWVRGKRARS